MPEIGKEIGKERILGGLLKTGQTTRYNSYLDDGYYEKGLSKQYTILTADQYDGTTSITLNLKTDVHSNNCVYDRRTKLMWSRYMAASIGPLSIGKLPWTTNVDGEGIFAYVAAANLAKLAGYSDWRIPSDTELLSLKIMEAPLALPDPTAFPGWTSSAPFWTSTTDPYSTEKAMNVSFQYGGEFYATKTLTYWVALVRGG